MMMAANTNQKRRPYKNKRYANNRYQGKGAAQAGIDRHEIARLLTVALLFIAVVWGAKQIDKVAIEAIIVQTALHRVDKADVRNIARAYMQAGFFTVDLDSFEQQLNNLPWVYRANIQRQWPRRLVIEIEEQTPHFRWGDQALLGTAGQMFTVNDLSAFKHLPRLQGVAGRRKYLLGLYHQYNARFHKAGAAIIELTEDARYNKVIRLANGIAINVGRENAERQIERCLQSFAGFSRAERKAIASIDLRHSNGFAVRWNH